MTDEVDIHVWCKQGTSDVMPLYTLSINKRALAVDMTLDGAVDVFKDYIDDMADAE